MRPRHKPVDPNLLTDARKLRHDDTRAEKRAWVYLRERRMLGLKLRRQFPIETYIVDFYCEQLRLIVELDGGIHDDPSQMRADEVRDIHLRELGYKVLRIPNGLLLQAPDQFLAAIQRFLPSPGPSGHPLPGGEG